MRSSPESTSMPKRTFFTRDAGTLMPESAGISVWRASSSARAMIASVSIGAAQRPRGYKFIRPRELYTIPAAESPGVVPRRRAEAKFIRHACEMGGDGGGDARRREEEWRGDGELAQPWAYRSPRSELVGLAIG